MLGEVLIYAIKKMMRHDSWRSVKLISVTLMHFVVFADVIRSLGLSYNSIQSRRIPPKGKTGCV
jgi:DMSO reductase anchor subunit